MNGDETTLNNGEILKSDFYQGVWDFIDFNDYLENWIKPNILTDLTTIFDGAAENFVKNKEPKNGRGDFLLAAILFSVFDNMGGFLASSNKMSRKTLSNIFRTANRIPSISDIGVIIAYFGRHALVHLNWPESMIFIEPDKAYGLNIYAYPDIGEYDELKGKHKYVRTKLYLRPKTNNEYYEGTKTVINIPYLFEEFKSQVLSGEMFENVNDDVFQQIKSKSIKACMLVSANIGDRRKAREHKGEEEIKNVNKELEEQIQNQMKIAVKEFSKQI